MRVRSIILKTIDRIDALLEVNLEKGIFFKKKLSKNSMITSGFALAEYKSEENDTVRNLSFSLERHVIISYITLLHLGAYYNYDVFFYHCHRKLSS